MKLLPFKTLETASQLKKHDHRQPGAFFRCSKCGLSKPLGGSGVGTGYGYKSHKSRLPICYACCGDMDRASMIKTGKAMLYLSGKGFSQCITNWPGTLKIKAPYVKTSWHNMAGRDGRRDAWFTGPDGKAWHGVNFGDSQVIRCKRLKGVR